MTNRRRRVLVPQSKSGLERFKVEIAGELGVPLTNDLSSADNRRHIPIGRSGLVGGNMVKRMVEDYERHLTD